MTSRMSELINDRRDETTRKYGHGRTQWLRLNRNREAMAAWQALVYSARTDAQLCDIGLTLWRAEQERQP